MWTIVWFFLHYVLSPIEVFAASDQHLLNMNYTRALLPALLFSYACSFMAMVFYPGGEAHMTLGSLVRFFPVMVCIIHNLFARLIQDTTTQDRLSNVKADLPFLRRACLLMGIVSTSTLEFVRFRSSTREWLDSIFSGGLLQLQGWLEITAVYANQEHLAVYIGAVLWLGLVFKDLKRAGMVEKSCTWLLVCGVACIPGAALVVG